MARIDQSVVYFNDLFGTNKVTLNFGSNSNRFVVVWALGSSGVTLTSVSVGGEASLTEYLSETNSLASSRKAKLWAGSVTGTGSKDVQLTVSGSGNLQIMAFAYEGVTGVRSSSAQKGYANPGNPSLTMTTVSGDICVLMGETLVTGSGVFVATSPAALVFSSQTFWIHAEQTATSTSTTIAGTWSSGSHSWEAMGLALVPAAPPSTFTETITLDDVVPGGVYSSSASAFTETITLDDVVPGGTYSPVPGTITTQAFKNWFGVVQASITVPKVAILKVSDLSSAVTLTNQTTNGSGVMSITNTAIVSGVSYLLVACDSGGSAFGCEVYTAT